jgi:hypothetical protein
MHRMFPPSFSVPVLDVIFDEKTQKQREIRFIPGEKSIYKDEQSVKDMPHKRSEIIFKDGWKMVYPQETLLLEYLKACNFNAGTKNRMPGTTVLFKEFKPEVISQDFLDKEELDVKARATVFNMKFEDMIVLAKGLGLNTNREAAEIKHDLLIRAKNNPSKFLADISSKNTKRKWAVLEAVDADIINIDKKTCTIKWSDGGVIFQSALGADIVEDFAEFTMNIEDGRNIFDRIQRQYEHKKKAEENIVWTDDQIVEKAIQHQIIEKKGSWHMYKGEKISQGLLTIKAKIADDANFRNELIEKISTFEEQTA